MNVECSSCWFNVLIDDARGLQPAAGQKERPREQVSPLGKGCDREACGRYNHKQFLMVQNMSLVPPQHGLVCKIKTRFLASGACTNSRRGTGRRAAFG
jgi:hypothetical protein